MNASLVSPLLCCYINVYWTVFHGRKLLHSVIQRVSKNNQLQIIQRFKLLNKITTNFNGWIGLISKVESLDANPREKNCLFNLLLAKSKLFLISFDGSSELSATGFYLIRRTTKDTYKCFLKELTNEKIPDHRTIKVF